jgi:hypothetical protein
MSLLLCSMDGMWSKLVLTTHERVWRDTVSGWAQGPNSERDSVMPCAVKSSFKTGLHCSLLRSVIQRGHNMNGDLKCREVKTGFCHKR